MPDPAKTIEEAIEGRLRPDWRSDTIYCRAVGPEGSAQLKLVGVEAGWLDVEGHLEQAVQFAHDAYVHAFDGEPEPARVAAVALPYDDREDGDDA